MLLLTSARSAWAGCEVISGADGSTTTPGSMVPAGPLAEPIPLNALYEIHAVSYPNGPSRGALYHVRPKAHVDRLRELEGNRFVPGRTEFSEAPELFTALGFRATTDPRVGEYWSTIPSAELLNDNIRRWNERVAGDPLRTVHVNFLTAGSHQQVEMARLAAQRYIGLAEPFSVHTEPYAVTNSPPPTPADHSRLVIDPRTGRVREANGLFNHDVTHAVNALFMPRTTVESFAEMSRLYIELWNLYDSPAVRAKGLRMTNAEAQNIREALIQYRYNGLPFDESRPGIAATRYISMVLLHSQSSYHGFEHMLGWLIRNREGLDPGTFDEQARGSTFQREAVFHLMRLGVRAPGSQPYFMSPVGIVTFQQATSTGGPLTLERALGFVLNTDRTRARTLLRDLREAAATRGDAELQATLADIERRYASFLARQFSPEELRALAQETRARHAAFGIRTPPPGAR